MKCNKCGNELNEGDLFCNKCGNKVGEDNIIEVNTEEKQNNTTEQATSEEYKSKLKQANDAAEMFLNEQNHNIFMYNQVCAKYGEVEQIGAHIPSTYIDELDFFVKANLLDDSIFFNTIERFEKVFDNLIRLALSNLKTDKEKEELNKKYNRDKIVSEYQKKLEDKKDKKQKNNRKWLIFVIIIAFIFFGIKIINAINEVTIPNLEGKTIQETKKILSNLDLNLKGNSNYNDEDVVTSQEPRYTNNTKVKKGTEIKVSVKTQEELKKQKEQEQNKSKIEKVIENWAEEVRQKNSGELKYDFYTTYRTTSDGTTVYRIKYSTSRSEIYYYQLVSLDSNYDRINKATKLYRVSNYSSIGESMDTYKFEYEYESIWGK